MTGPVQLPRGWFRACIAAAASCLASVPVASQTPLTARAAYDSVMSRRAEAQELWRAGERSAALDALDGVVDFIEQRHVRDLGQSAIYLQARLPEVRVDQACMRARLGQRTEALGLLEAAYEEGAPSDLPARIARDCPELHALRADPAYRRLELLWRSQRRRWGDSALVTRFREELPVEERIAGLSLLWAHVKFGFPSFEVNPGFDWDSLYLAHIDDVLSTPETFAYYRLLERFVAELGDAHTEVYLPGELWPRRYSRVPLVTRRVEGQVVVTRILHPRIDSLGVRVGQFVETVDGLPVDRYAAEHVMPFQRSSTPQDLEVRTFGYQLLMGDSARPVRVGLRRADGSRFQLELPRHGWAGAASEAATRDSVLPGNIGYLRVDGFNEDTLSVYLPAAMMRLKDTRALVIDMRGNRGGRSGFGYLILSMLTREPFLTSSARALEYVALNRARRSEPAPILTEGFERQPHRSLFYDRPVVVLIGAETFSAGEDFVVAYDAMERGPLIGEPTGGNSGQPFRIQLPGGGTAIVRTKHDSYPDGREFIGIGVQPDVVVSPTIAGIRAGRDEALERAVAELERLIRE